MGLAGVAVTPVAQAAHLLLVGPAWIADPQSRNSVVRDCGTGLKAPVDDWVTQFLDTFLSLRLCRTQFVRRIRGDYH